MNQGVEKPRKKVLFLVTKATWGGAQKYVHDLATHLPRDQFDASVAYGEAGRMLTMLKEKNMPTHAIPALGRDITLSSDIASFFQIFLLLRQVRPNVLHVNSSKAAALGALAGRLCGVSRIIFTAHGWPFKENRNFLARGIIYFISWFTAVLSHATIVVSKHDETIGKRMLIVSKKIHYVPLGIEPPDFLSRDVAWERLPRPGLGIGAYRIVTIGELTKNKGHRYAIDAIAELNKRGVDVAYFIIGDGELRAQLQQQARERDVADQVHFLGFVENASQYLKAFDVFLLPSIKEGTPYVLLEAEVAGLQIVATTVIDGFWTASEVVTLVPPAHTPPLPQKIQLAL